MIRAVEKQDAETAACFLQRALKGIVDEMIPADNVYIRGGKIILGHCNDAAWREFVRFRLILKKYY